MQDAGDRGHRGSTIDRGSEAGGGETSRVKGMDGYGRSMRGSGSGSAIE